MAVPPWLTFLCGLMVLAFGGYRVAVGFRSNDAQKRAEKRKGGLYSLPRRRHMLFGVVYLLMGVFLILTAFGIDPTGLK